MIQYGGHDPEQGTMQLIVFPLVKVSLKLVLLGVIVFAACHFVIGPNFSDNAIVAVIVVLVYSFIDIVISKIKNLLCSAASEF